MLTVKQFRAISLVVMLLAVVLSIGSVSMARFAKVTLSSSQLGVELSMLVGAFHACFETDVLGPGSLVSVCGSIDKNCQVTIQGRTIPQPDVPGTDLPSWYRDDCSKFNTFRGILVTAILLVSISLIVAIVYLIVNSRTSPKWALGLEITYIVLAALASIFFVGSLIALDQTISNVPTVGLVDEDGNSLSFKAEKYTSFVLAAVAVAFALIAIIVWVVARFFGKPATATGLEEMPLNEGNSPSGSYVPPPLPGQPQPLFNYGAPPPQPNYQYGNNTTAPPTNYGFGYQPPPPQPGFGQ